MCTLATLWCLLINYTLVGPNGVTTHEDQWEFNSESACHELQDYYKPIIGRQMLST